MGFKRAFAPPFRSWCSLAARQPLVNTKFTSTDVKHTSNASFNIFTVVKVAQHAHFAKTISRSSLWAGGIWWTWCGLLSKGRHQNSAENSAHRKSGTHSPSPFLMQQFTATASDCMHSRCTTYRGCDRHAGAHPMRAQREGFALDVGQQGRPGHAARDGTAGGAGLEDGLASHAGELGGHMADDLEVRRHVFEWLGDLGANLAQPPATGAAAAELASGVLVTGVASGRSNYRWLLAQRQLVRLGSATIKTINYSLKRWTELTRFVEDSGVPISKSWVENPIRPAAAVMSLPRSARITGHDPTRTSRTRSIGGRPTRSAASLAARFLTNDSGEWPSVDQSRVGCPDAYPYQHLQSWRTLMFLGIVNSLKRKSGNR